MERLENRQQERDSARQEVLVEISSRMMGLQDDPRVVLQVLGVPCEGGARPSNEQLLRALRTVSARVAMPPHHRTLSNQTPFVLTHAFSDADGSYHCEHLPSPGILP